jgi:hypothetical protein
MNESLKVYVKQLTTVSGGKRLCDPAKLDLTLAFRAFLK